MNSNKKTNDLFPGIVKKIRRGIIKVTFINFIKRKDFFPFYSFYL
jgi:hypothetical protein